MVRFGCLDRRGAGRRSAQRGLPRLQGLSAARSQRSRGRSADVQPRDRVGSSVKSKRGSDRRQHLPGCTGGTTHSPCWRDSLLRRSAHPSSIAAARSTPNSTLDSWRSRTSRLLLHGEPANPVYLKDAAEIALMDQDWDRAAPLLHRLVAATADPKVTYWVATNRAVALEAAGRDAARAGRHAEAASRFETLAEENPDDARFRRSQAHALRAAGNAPRSGDGLPPDSGRRYGGRRRHGKIYAWMLNTQRRYAEAWKVHRAAAAARADAGLLELQARTAIWAGQTAESVHLIRALLDRRPNDCGVVEAAGRSVAAVERRSPGCRGVRGCICACSRTTAQARERLAQILTQLGSLEEATAEYRRLLLADPGNPEFLRSLGLLQETGGALEAAADSYRRALNASPSASPELLLRLARLHKWMAHPEAAVPWYERYLQEVNDDRLRRPAQAELALSLFESEQSRRRVVSSARVG